ncbi:hypothetical protein SNE40_002729 [Patella caerulea]|uniref:Protein quiver n=1 Tax=Patella caerulea TaxID=87958 RepID=A0AAN8KEH0_PATCE
MESSYVLLAILSLLAYFKEGNSFVFCRKCYSSMGGCGETVDWIMYGWRYCGNSEFCVKVIDKSHGDTRIIRDCEENLMKSTRHRLQMPVLKRHGYCLDARLNNPYQPLKMTNSDIKYCFCNEYPGCNSAVKQDINILSLVLISSLALFFIQKFN